MSLFFRTCSKNQCSFMHHLHMHIKPETETTCPSCLSAQHEHHHTYCQTNSGDGINSLEHLNLLFGFHDYTMGLYITFCMYFIHKQSLLYKIHEQQTRVPKSTYVIWLSRQTHLKCDRHDRWEDSKEVIRCLCWQQQKKNDPFMPEVPILCFIFCAREGLVGKGKCGVPGN